MSNSSIISALQKLRLLLTREEKIKWLGIVGFAFVSSLLEIFTASVIVVFAQTMNQPEMGQKYLSMIGSRPDLTSGEILFRMAIIVGLVYIFKNIVNAIEVFFQNFSIQKMNYHFKNKILYRYAEADYVFFLTKHAFNKPRSIPSLRTFQER